MELEEIIKGIVEVVVPKEGLKVHVIAGFNIDIPRDEVIKRLFDGFNSMSKGERKVMQGNIYRFIKETAVLIKNAEEAKKLMEELANCPKLKV